MLRVAKIPISLAQYRSIFDYLTIVTSSSLTNDLFNRFVNDHH